MLPFIGEGYHAPMNPSQSPFLRALLPNTPGLVLEDAYHEDDGLLIVLRSTILAVCCPLCQIPSTSVHSHYQRSPADLPLGGHPVRLVLHVRKFFCKNASCKRCIFAERLPDVVAPRARTTERLTVLLRAIAFALGGEAGARLAKRIGVIASPATLISLIRKTPLPTPNPARILGIDDWAKRKGRSYGTAIVDLQEHRLIELLPDREANTLADWLRANPGAEVISRDRSGDYATGVRRGAPAATQVADRWHLLSNWKRSIETVFDRHRSCIKRVVLPTPEPVGKAAAAALPAKSVNRRRSSAKVRSARTQARRLALYNTIQERYAKGEYIKTIARDLEIDFRTARKYALSDECPTRKPHKWSRGRMLDPYEPYLRARWKEGCKNGRGLYREIKAHGYPGSRTQVAAFIAKVRREENDGKPQRAFAIGEPLTPRKASMLLLRLPQRRTEAESAARAQLRNAHAEIATTIAFTERFVEIVRELQGEKLGKWLSDAEASGIREIWRFAHKIRQDEAAVRAGCTLQWSNGQTEGKITKLKAIKRSMYGRAKFDLLRRRALYAA
jgi:transposase